VKRPPMVVLGIVVMLLGLLFMFQGLGYVKGSSMTNSNFWAVAGPVIALVGAALLWTGLRGNRGRSGSADDV
jgi:hypothetical protein